MIVRQFLIHNVRLETRTESSFLADALDIRLRYFAATSVGQPACRIDLQLATPAELADAEPPKGEPVQLLFQAGEAKAAYHAPTDVMYLAYTIGLKAIIYESEGYARILIPEDAIWTIRRLKHAVFMLSLTELLRTQGLFNTHAAGLAIGGKGLLFPAESGSGKTTLTLALARGGFDFMSDDVVFLKREGDLITMKAFPDDVDVTEDTIRIIPEVRELLRPPLPGRPKRQVSVADAYGTTTVSQCAPAAVICPRIASADHTRLELLSPVEAFFEITKSVTLARPAAAQEHLDIIGMLLRQVPCYRMHTGRDLESIPDLLRELVA